MQYQKPLKEILLLDDDPDIHSLVKVMIQSYSMRVKLVSFFNIQEAIDYTKNHSIDLVLLDLCLKQSHDGSKFILNLAQRAREGWVVPPIVILSALKNGEVVDYVSELGAVDYLQKPLTFLTLHQAINRSLNLPKEAARQNLDKACIHID